MRKPTSLLVPDVVRVAVDARDLASDTRGIGRYTRAILRRLARRGDVELTLLVLGLLPALQRKRLAAAIGTTRFRIASSPAGADVVWHPANGTFFESEVPSVVTVHDAVPFRFPDPDARKNAHRQAPFLRSIASAQRIIAVSHFGRSEVRDVFGFPDERIDVIYHGVEPFFSPGDSPDREPYFLFVGDPYAEKRKNFPLLYNAYCAAFSGGGPGLLVVGPSDPANERARYAGLAGDDASGGVDVRLRDLYRGAVALCVPSYYETFGMPVIEAMACGTPVVASAASCLPEIAGDAALFAAPHDEHDWQRALAQVYGDAGLRARLSAGGIARAAAFDWDASAQQHLDVFRSIA